MVDILILWLISIPVWSVLVTLLFLTKKLTNWMLNTIVDARIKDIKATNIGIGIGVMTSGFFGALMGITQTSSLIEVSIRIVLAFTFGVFGAIIILINIANKRD